MMIKVVIVNELNVISEGLELIINSQEDMRVLGIIHDQMDPKNVLKDHPDVILFHSKLMNTTSSEEVHTYKKQYPEVKLVYISPRFNKHLFFEAIQNKPDG